MQGLIATVRPISDSLLRNVQICVNTVLYNTLLFGEILLEYKMLHFCYEMPVLFFGMKRKLMATALCIRCAERIYRRDKGTPFASGK